MHYQVSRAVGSSMSYVKDIRLVLKKDGMYTYICQNRHLHYAVCIGQGGLGFLEFYQVSDATTWMNENKVTNSYIYGVCMS